MYGLAAKKLDISKGVNKVDAMKLKKNYGYFLKQVVDLDQSKWVDAARAVLEHHFENHSFCGEWCQRRGMTDLELDLDRKKTGKYYRCKKRDQGAYYALAAAMARFTTIEAIHEVAHGEDTKLNESLNNTISSSDTPV